MRRIAFSRQLFLLVASLVAIGAQGCLNAVPALRHPLAALVR